MDGPTELGVNISIADAGWVEQEAKSADSQPGLVLWTDGSRDENGAVGFAVVWWKGRSWAGRKAHMGFFQKAYDTECAAIARGSGAIRATQGPQSPHLHRCISRDHADDARRAWLGPDLRPSGEEGDSSPARAFCRD